MGAAASPSIGAARAGTGVGPVLRDARVETRIGEVYCKAGPPLMPQESGAMPEVSRQYPDLLPAPRAVDTGRGWRVLPDCSGDSLLRVPDLSRWQAVLWRWAHLHMAQARAVEEWWARG